MGHRLGSEQVDLKKVWADYTGVTVSGLCAAHCAATPALAVLFPHWLERYQAPWIHILFLALVAPLAIYAFKKCYGEHGRRLPFLLGGSGLLILASWELLGMVHHDLVYGSALTLLGSALVIAGHWLNLRYCKHTRSSSVRGHGTKNCC